MTRPVSILLPGLDGTGDLFAPFVAAAPPEMPVQVVRLPDDKPRGYAELADYLLPQLPAESFVLIAESFSGPLAVLLANQCPSVAAVVLCATFVRPPLPALRYLPDFIWRTPPPAILLSHLMAAGNRSLGRALHDAVLSLDPSIIASRIATALRVDVSADLARVTQPLLCLRATQDRLVLPRSIKQIADAKPNVNVVNIDAPHLVLQSCPVDCWHAVRAFLERSSLVQSPT